MSGVGWEQSKTPAISAFYRQSALRGLASARGAKRLHISILCDLDAVKKSRLTKGFKNRPSRQTRLQILEIQRSMSPDRRQPPCPKTVPRQSVRQLRNWDFWQNKNISRKPPVNQQLGELRRVKRFWDATSVECLSLPVGNRPEADITMSIKGTRFGGDPEP
jgi:hypothetical protein